MQEKKKEEIKIIDKRRVDPKVTPSKEERDRIVDKLSKKRKNDKTGN